VTHHVKRFTHIEKRTFVLHVKKQQHFTVLNTYVRG